MKFVIEEAHGNVDSLKITGLIWLDEIVEKLERKHNVRPQEVREVLTKHPRFLFVEKGHLPKEHVYAALGQNLAGRYLIIFFIHKLNNQALILSARDMTPAERRNYDKK